VGWGPLGALTASTGSPPLNQNQWSTLEAKNLASIYNWIKPARFPPFGRRAVKPSKEAKCAETQDVSSCSSRAAASPKPNPSCNDYTLPSRMSTTQN
jgi:hypothetical protein